MKRSQQIDIKRTLALSGAFSFLCSCSQACLLPFLTLYLRQLGLTPAMAGVVMGARRFLGLAWSPAAGLLAARYRKRRAVIVCSLLLSAAVALLLLLLPPLDGPAGGRPCSAGGPEAAPSRGPTPTGAGSDPSTAWTNPTAPSATATDPTDMGSAPTDMGSVPTVTGGSPPPQVDETVALRLNGSSPASPAVRNVRSEALPEGEGGAGLGFLGSLKEMDTHTQLFLSVLVIASVWECFSAPLERAADDGLFEYLDQADASDRHASAGPRGPWGLLGAACGAGGAGLLAGRLGCPLAAGVHFYGYAGLAVLALPLAACLPLHAGGKAGRVSRSGGPLKALRLVAGCPRARLAAVTAVAAGAARAAAEDFLLWQMQDHGSGQLHMGLALALAALAQAAYPLLSGRLARFLGPSRVLVAGAAGLALQSFYYSFLWGPWAALPAQPLTCLGAGAVWWALGVQSEDVAVPGAERSVRRLYGALSRGLGGGLGSLAGGLVAQRFGLAWLFRGVGVALMAWCACLPLLQWRAPLRQRVNYSRLLAADGSEASDSGSEQERDWLDRAMDEDCRQHANGKTLTSGF
ncbi:major facilitator superfamily domain-containing protein 6-like isoform 1-T3 [Menidia menidia]